MHGLSAVILNGYNSSVHGSDSESDFYHDNLSSSSPNKAAIRRKLLLSNFIHIFPSSAFISHLIAEF